MRFRLEPSEPYKVLRGRGGHEPPRQHNNDASTR